MAWRVKKTLQNGIDVPYKVFWGNEGRLKSLGGGGDTYSQTLNAFYADSLMPFQKTINGANGAKTLIRLWDTGCLKDIIILNF